jgi:predicted AAA+ superfamily ATPase
MMIKRIVDMQNIEKLLDIFPVAAILGVRQCGKTTISKEFAYNYFFDLENPRDLARLDNPQLALEDLEGLIVIDEIQRKPNLFPLIRFLVDNKPKQKYIILGSASKNLIKQSSESLAGRIGYYQLGGFRLADVGTENLNKLWLRGTLPRSYLAGNEEESLIWRENYITTYLERDLPQLGIQIPAGTLRRFWTMLAHYHGQILNYSELARSFGISDMTVRKYVDILEGTFMLRTLQPWYENIGKRLVKKPKIYIRDPGIIHSLMSIETLDQLLSFNKLGASWEGFALEYVCKSINKKDEDFYFWATHSGSEIDLFWQHAGKKWCVEFKYNDAPRLTKSLEIVSDDLRPTHIWVVYPGKEKYKIAQNITVLPLKDIPAQWIYGT